MLLRNKIFYGVFAVHHPLRDIGFFFGSRLVYGLRLRCWLGFFFWHCQRLVVEFCGGVFAHKVVFRFGYDVLFRLLLRLCNGFGNGLLLCHNGFRLGNSLFRFLQRLKVGVCSRRFGLCFRLFGLRSDFRFAGVESLRTFLHKSLGALLHAVFLGLRLYFQSCGVKVFYLVEQQIFIQRMRHFRVVYSFHAGRDFA